MIINTNGISINIATKGNVLKYKVLEQTKEATEILRKLTSITDPETGFSLRTNERPSYNKKAKRFFLRGIQKHKDNRQVKITFPSSKEASEAAEMLRKLVEKVVEPEYNEYTHESDSNAGAAVPGGTAHIRFQFINREMAERLRLTNCSLYPEEIPEWMPTKPLHLKNDHANEHLAQCVDVLNKSIKDPIKVHGIINPHKASVDGSKKAVELLKSCFQYSVENDCLVEFWRLITAQRACDVIKRYSKKSYEKREANYVEPRHP